ncbi:MAG: NAD(P)/FAD-dependent oxidoreductase [Candidatus Omnitrophota bacterium]
MTACKTDIVIVGAGPAGSTAAYILGKKGFHVILIDKQTFPRPKLCGGCLTAKTMRALDRIFHESEETLWNHHVLDFQSNRFEIRFKTQPRIDTLSPLPFYFVDRTIYDQFLLQKVKNVGVNVIEGEKVIAVEGEQTNNRLTTSGGRRIEATYVIGADGVNSVVRTSLFNRNPHSPNHRLWKRNLATTVEIALPKAGNLFAVPDVPLLVFGYVHYGYGWIFPNKEKIILGMGGLNRKNRKNKNIVHAFKAMLSDYRFPLDAASVRGHGLPSGNYLLRPVNGTTLLVGDAAGWVDPMLGEGIYHAHRTGELAAQAISDAMHTPMDIESHYSALLHRQLLPELVYAHRLRPFLYNPLHHAMDYSLVKFASPRFGTLIDVVHGNRSYKWFRQKRL